MPEKRKSTEELVKSFEEAGAGQDPTELAVEAALSRASWIAKNDYVQLTHDVIKKLLGKKLAGLDPEKIVQPEPYIGVPVLRALSYSMDSGELRYMYLTLLANAMDPDTKSLVHPSFVHLIEQMSPLDARIFKLLAEMPRIPMITIFGKDRETGELAPLLKHIIPNADIAPFPDVTRSLANLSRCGLIRLLEDKYYPDEDDYDVIRTDNNYRALYYELLETFGADCELEEEPQMIEVTDSGRAFYAACLKEKNREGA
ncbi:MAG: DUF4393 domain-containing protein [Oscillospiraceae bacterium]|jgi:hypothetical protein